MMQLSRSELNLIDLVVLGGKRRLVGLSEGSGLSVPRISQLVTTLSSKGLIRKKKRGRAVWVQPEESTLADDLTRLFRYGQFEPQEVLADSKLSVLMSLSNKRLDKGELAVETGLSPETIRKYLRSLVRRGVVRRDGDRFALSSTVPHLSAFLREWARSVNRRKLKEIAENGIILWEQGAEFIFAVPVDESPTEGVPTGLSAMYDHGIELLVDEKYYHYAPWLSGLNPEDFAIDAILVAPNSTRVLSFALLLLRSLEHPDREHLVKRTEAVGIPGKGVALIEYLDGRGVEDPLFPTPEEFEALRDLHGVTP